MEARVSLVCGSFLLDVVIQGSASNTLLVTWCGERLLDYPLREHRFLLPCLSSEDRFIFYDLCMTFEGAGRKSKC